MTNPDSVVELCRWYFATLYEERLFTYPAVPLRLYTEPLDEVAFSASDAETLFRGANIFSSMGKDDIHSRILEKAANQLAPKLHKLFLESLITEIIPSCWKGTIFALIYKSLDHFDLHSFRPIRLT